MRHSFLRVVCVLSAVSGAALADTISGGVGNAFQNFPASLNNSGNPYWNNPSRDPGITTTGNIGFFETKQGPFATNPVSPNAGQQWYGNSDGTAPTDFTFVKTAPALKITFAASLAGMNSSYEFGIYTNTGGTPVKQVIWSAGTINGLAAGTQVNVTPAASSYGFYLSYSGHMYFTQSSKNTDSLTTQQHFAVFANGLTPGFESFFLGIDDALGFDTTVERTGDYNDLIIRVDSLGANIPEPSVLSMIGLGLAGLGIYGRRRRRG